MSQQGTQIEQPEWMAGFVSKPARGNPNWKRGGPSPNPSGRPAELGMERSKLTKQMLKNAGGILEAMIDKALDGDASAASLILSRIIAPLRSNTERVQFDFDATASVARQVEQVLDGIAAGAVPADIGRMVIDAIGTLSDVRAAELLEARINALEAKFA